MMQRAKVFPATIFATALILVSGTIGLAKDDSDSKLQRGSAVVSTEKPNGKPTVRARILVKASPAIVWHAIHEERHKNPDLAYSKVISGGESKAESILEEKFVLLPVIGEATATLKMNETPMSRIDFKLVKSDLFKAMEGAWILTPADDGRSTVLELNSHLQMSFGVPSMILTSLTSRKLERRVTHVKDMAEKHAQIAKAAQNVN
jgi:hypothetical protein